MGEGRSQESGKIGITEDVVGIIVLEFCRPCLLKILTFSANGSKKLVPFWHKIRLKSLQINTFRFNQQTLNNFC